jgi:hypothetical protein
MIWHFFGMFDEKDPKNIRNLLRDHGESSLRGIVRKVQRWQVIDNILKPCLPENLRPHCYAAGMTATHLTVLVDSAAWLTHLRYCKPQLLQQLKKNPQCAYLQDLQFRIQPLPTVEVKTPEPMPRKSLSAENRELLQSAAEGVSNPLLKKALLKLSQ